MSRPRLHARLALYLMPRPIVRTYFDGEHASVTFAFGNDMSDDIAALDVSADLTPRAARVLRVLLRRVSR